VTLTADKPLTRAHDYHVIQQSIHEATFTLIDNHIKCEKRIFGRFKSVGAFTKGCSVIGDFESRSFVSCVLLPPVWYSNWEALSTT
jgi:hypothetical protein